MLDEVVALNRLFIEENKGLVTWPEMPEIICQEVQMKQLFSNLIVNSIKYRKDSVPPVVEIICEDKPGKWLFKVSDNGKGVDPEYHTAVLILFRRVDVSDSSDGTGMGLATNKKIVEQHGGKIWVESERWAGAKIKFTISKLPG